MIQWFEERTFATEAERQAMAEPTVIEPFGVPRSLPRMLFDFAILTACITPNNPELPLLDFGAGTGWITELLGRMGKRVVAFDIHNDLEVCLQNRIAADRRLVSQHIGFEQGDGHQMPFADGSFSNLLCYDTLHHMHSYPKVFGEFFRVLAPGGRAIFVEPGARHSQSPATIAFLEQQKAHDPTWIERDVVLEEIDEIARQAGLTGLTVVPIPHPDNLVTFDVENWQQFRNVVPSSERTMARERFCDHLGYTNYNDRVVFYTERKP
ncbi:MAG TPA: class I SAM-dependent methyltransferase [Nodosilinea sp.]|nr:class I SAM-dependent methyltransferase [Nodosilinea sp.]